MLMHFFFVAASADDDLMPLSLVEAKAWLRAQTTDDDLLIADLVRTAAERIEGHSWAVSGGTREITLYAPSFKRVPIYPAPLVTVDSVSYYDGEGELTVLADTEWQLGSEFGVPVLIPAAGKEWPATADRKDAVVVTVTAGWASRDAVPNQIKTAARILLSHFYDNREMPDVMTGAVDVMLSKWRNRMIIQ